MRTLASAAGRWTAGLLGRRPWALIGTAASLALTVAFVSSLGAFVTSSRASLTTRATNSVAVDWQVQVTPQGTAARVDAALHQVPGTRAILPVSYARVPQLSATAGGSTRTTGAAEIVALPRDYFARVPHEVRYLVGAHDGVLLQQQTASNLGLGPGGSVTVIRPNGRRATLRVDGVIDLPQADSFFQVVGAPAGAGASAPPDNVIVVPPALFGSLAGGAQAIRQFHVILDHAQLPTDPGAAADAVTQRANHFAIVVAGGALVGDNLAAALSGAREDAIYAQLLFLLLGLPGLALALIVAVLVVGLRGEQRRRETALLLLRGASARTVVNFTLGEALLTGAAGVVIGLPLGALAARIALQAGTSLSLSWTVIAGLSAFVLAGATQVLPVLRTASRFRSEGVAAAAAPIPSTRSPWPLRAGLDFLLLGGALIATVLAARSGYKVVVVPEGVPVTSVNYAALLGPALAWPGFVLLTWRVCAFILSRRTGAGIAHGTSAPELVAATLRRRRQPIARGAAGLAAALALGVSTAVFTATYDRQAHLDVALTVGSDVGATALAGTAVSPATVSTVAHAPGTVAITRLRHRFAYVGSDLQDLYGIEPGTVAQATSLQNSFVPGSSIPVTVAQMKRVSDGVLLSAETIRDYQLHPGDLIRLGLPGLRGGREILVPFHVVGQISEFPTAPRDSFIVANASYVEQVTGSPAQSSFLVKSSNPAATSAYLRSHLGQGWRVSDIGAARSSVTTASGLAATDLGGLARLELAFAFAFAIACSALALALGILGRRRALVLLAALGATARQRGSFLAAEGRALLAGGVVGGVGIGGVIGYLLVKVLTGIFDPPPDWLVVPLPIVIGLAMAAAVTGIIALAVVGRLAARASPSQLRDL